MGNSAARRQPYPVYEPYPPVYYSDPYYGYGGHRRHCHGHSRYHSGYHSELIMDKIDNPYLIMLERLHILDQSIHILNLVNNDLRQILQKQKRLPQFIYDSFKRSTINKSKTSSTLPPAQLPIESEEIRLAASVIDKAKRTIENVGEKKSKQSSSGMIPALTSVQSNTVQNNRSKTSSSSSSSMRPSSANSTIAPSSDSSLSQQQQQQPVRRYVPAHMKAPFLTQPEKKRRSSSSTRTSIQTNSSKKSGTTPRPISQQRRQSSSSTTQSIVEILQKTASIPSILPVQNEKSSIINNQNNNDLNDETIIPEQTSNMITTEEPKNISNEISEIDVLPVSEPIILNRTLIKPLRRLWKQNQNLRLRLEIEFNKRSTLSSSPVFIDRLNEKIHSPTVTDEIHIPNIEVLLQLAIKLRTIVLYLLEHSTFDDLDGAMKRLNTLKYLVNQYHIFFTSNINILVAKHDYRPSNININIEEWLNKPKINFLNRNIVRYSDDSQLIAFTEVRFKQFENECRWIELNLHEQMIMQFKQSLSKQKQNQNSLQIYRELMCLVTGLQTSTPIVVENKFE
ncbi:unnamed protein product [Rotaria sp. Silwood1]|nr:unnamed protein product [Rotaria sp. Silwood1]CAF4756195.1 unnamed protein product [Rotaria sp. Silwood1]